MASGCGVCHWPCGYRRYTARTEGNMGDNSVRCIVKWRLCVITLLLCVLCWLFLLNTKTSSNGLLVKENYWYQVYKGIFKSQCRPNKGVFHFILRSTSTSCMMEISILINKTDLICLAKNLILVMANQSNFIVIQQFLCWIWLSTIYLFVFQLSFVWVLQNSFETKIFFHITLISKINLYLKRYLNKLFLDLLKVHKYGLSWMKSLNCSYYVESISRYILKGLHKLWDKLKKQFQSVLGYILKTRWIQKCLSAMLPKRICLSHFGGT